MKTNLRIGEVLMERGCITQEQMEQAGEELEQIGERVWDWRS